MNVIIPVCLGFFTSIFVSGSENSNDRQESTLYEGLMIPTLDLSGSEYENSSDNGHGSNDDSLIDSPQLQFTEETSHEALGPVESWPNLKVPTKRVFLFEPRRPNEGYQVSWMPPARDSPSYQRFEKKTFEMALEIGHPLVSFTETDMEENTEFMQTLRPILLNARAALQTEIFKTLQVYGTDMTYWVLSKLPLSLLAKFHVKYLQSFDELLMRYCRIIAHHVENAEHEEILQYLDYLPSYSRHSRNAKFVGSFPVSTSQNHLMLHAFLTINDLRYKGGEPIWRDFEINFVKTDTRYNEFVYLSMEAALNSNVSGRPRELLKYFIRRHSFNNDGILNYFSPRQLIAIDPGWVDASSYEWFGLCFANSYSLPDTTYRSFVDAVLIDSAKGALKDIWTQEQFWQYCQSVNMHPTPEDFKALFARLPKDSSLREIFRVDPATVNVPLRSTEMLIGIENRVSQDAEGVLMILVVAA